MLYFIKYGANHKPVNRKSIVKFIHLIEEPILVKFEGLEKTRKNIIEIRKL